VVAFAPSTFFILAGGRRFEQIRANTTIQGFLAGAGPSVVGAIAGSAIPLGAEIGHLWQAGLLAGAAIWLLIARKGVVTAIVASGALGVVAALAGAPVAR
jgi:chromate transporter